MWLSLVERYVRDVEVASSNLVISTKIKEGRLALPSLIFVWFLRFELLKRLRLIALRWQNNETLQILGAKLSSESCHLDQNQRRKACPSFFDFRLVFTIRTSQTLAFDCFALAK